MSQTSCNAISHPELQQFWADKVGRDETDWDSFWATFKQLPGIANCIRTEADRACFQAAVHVNGDPKRVSAAAMDMAFPPGLSLEANVYRQALSLAFYNYIETLLSCLCSGLTFVSSVNR